MLSPKSPPESRRELEGGPFNHAIFIIIINNKMKPCRVILSFKVSINQGLGIPP
jgi:hypothetical protein